MKRAIDLAILYEGGTNSQRIDVDEDNIPAVGDALPVEIEGRMRSVQVYDTFPEVLFDGRIVTLMHCRIVEARAS
jgi:hypothetical protein